MKARLHTLRHREPQGWDDVLFSALRRSPARPDVKRVEKLLSLLVAAEGHSRERANLGGRGDRLKGADEALRWAHQYQASMNAYVRTLEQIDKALRRYRWRATVSQKRASGRFQYELYCVANPKNRWGEWEGAIVAKLLKLAEKPGELSRFRRCAECQKWFCAVTGHQQFCGEACRRRHSAQNPEFKEKRRIYMRERYRPLLKELERRSVRNAKSTRKG